MFEVYDVFEVYLRFICNELDKYLSAQLFRDLENPLHYSCYIEAAFDWVVHKVKLLREILSPEMPLYIKVLNYFSIAKEKFGFTIKNMVMSTCSLTILDGKPTTQKAIKCYGYYLSCMHPLSHGHLLNSTLHDGETDEEGEETEDWDIPDLEEAV